MHRKAVNWEQDSLAKIFKEALSGRIHPVIGVIDAEGEIDNILSGPNLWTMAFNKYKELDQAGIKRGDVLKVHSNGINFLIYLFSSYIGNFVLEPSIEKLDSEYILQKISPETKKMLLEKNIRLILYTSGSEGSPKRIYYSDNLIKHQLKHHLETNLYQADATRLSLLPWHHSFGIVLDLILGLLMKNCVLIPFDPADKVRPSWLLKVLKNNQIDIFASVPKFLEVIIKLHEKDNIPAIQTLHIGGASLPNSLKEKIINWQRNGLNNSSQLIEGYGLTEAGPGVLLDGKPVGCEVKIQDNELYVTTKEWSYNDESLFDENKSIEKMYQTNDLAVVNDSSILITGRKKFAAKNLNGEFVSFDFLETQIEGMLGAYHVSLKMANNQIHCIAVCEEMKEDGLSFSNQSYLREYFQKNFNLDLCLQVKNKNFVNLENIIKIKDKKLNLFEIECVG